MAGGTFPTSVPSYTHPNGGTDDLSTYPHSTMHEEEQGDIEALASKVGPGAGTPTAGAVLKGAASVGNSEWSTEVPVGDGTLSVGDLLVVKSLSPMVVEGVASDTYGPAVTPRLGGYMAPPAVVSTGTRAEGNLELSPLLVMKAATIDRIGLEVTSSGTSGAVVRLGIYATSSTGVPGDLVVDAGTIDGTSATVQEITISEAVEPGLYWLGASIQGGAATRPATRTNTTVYSNFVGENLAADISLTHRGCFIVSSVTGALPASASGGFEAGISHRVFVRFAT